MARKGLVNLLVSLFLLGKYWLSGWRGYDMIWSLHDSRVLGCGESPGQRRSTPQGPSLLGTKRRGEPTPFPVPFRVNPDSDYVAHSVAYRLCRSTRQAPNLHGTKRRG